MLFTRCFRYLCFLVCIYKIPLYLHFLNRYIYIYSYDGFFLYFNFASLILYVISLLFIWVMLFLFINGKEDHSRYNYLIFIVTRALLLLKFIVSYIYFILSYFHVYSSDRYITRLQQLSHVREAFLPIIFIANHHVLICFKM